MRNLLERYRAWKERRRRAKILRKRESFKRDLDPDRYDREMDARIREESEKYWREVRAKIWVYIGPTYMKYIDPIVQEFHRIVDPYFWWWTPMWEWVIKHTIMRFYYFMQPVLKWTDSIYTFMDGRTYEPYVSANLSAEDENWWDRGRFLITIWWQFILFWSAALVLYFVYPALAITIGNYFALWWHWDEWRDWSEIEKVYQFWETNYMIARIWIPFVWLPSYIAYRWTMSWK